jgi:biopolymer transport protein ExbD
VRILGSGPKTGRRHYAQDLNLVPFIDFFSTLIIFLMMTVVFDKLAAVQINMGAEDTSSKIQVPKDSVKKIEASLKITLTKNQATLFDAGKTTVLNKEPGVDESGHPIERFNPDALKEFMANARAKYPDKKDIVVFSTDDAVYADLIAVLDSGLSEKFTELVVTGTE